MPPGTVLIAILLVALIAVAPRWDYSRGWGFAPSGLVGTLLVIVVVLLLLGWL
jgi:hypothetical protein